MGFLDSEVLPDIRQIELLYKFMMGFHDIEHLQEDEQKMVRYLIVRQLIRIIPWQDAERVITTLEGVALFRRYYNGLNREEAIARHTQYLLEKQKN